MTIKSSALDKFFDKQKKANIESLISTNFDNSKKKNRKKPHEVGILINGNVQNSVDASKKNTLAMREQSVSNTLAIREQSVSNTLAMREQSVSNTLAGTLAIREQSVSNSGVNPDPKTVVGFERKLLMHVFKNCKLSASLETPPLTTEELIEYLKIEAIHLRNIIFRLCKKKFLVVSECKKGPYGWRKFKLSKDIFQQLILDEKIDSTLAIREQSVSNTLAQALAISPSSSINILNTTTELNTGESNFDQEEFFLAIHESLDALKNEGVHLERHHITQLLQDVDIHPGVIDMSLDAFLYDIISNSKLKSINKDPISFFMGIMRTSKAYTLPKGYKTKRQRTLENLKYVLENELKIENEIKEKLFNKWVENLSNEENLNIINAHKNEEELVTITNKTLPSHLINVTKQNILKRYFNKYIFSTMENEYIKKINVSS